MLEMKNTNNDNQLIQELLQLIKQMSGKIDNLEKSNKDILNKLPKDINKDKLTWKELYIIIVENA